MQRRKAFRSAVWRFNRRGARRLAQEVGQQSSDSARHAVQYVSLGRKKQMLAHIAYDALPVKILFEQSELADRTACLPEACAELPAEIDIDAAAVLQEVIAQHGIFAHQASRLYSFAHLTFQEYYTAKVCRG